MLGERDPKQVNEDMDLTSAKDPCKLDSACRF